MPPYIFLKSRLFWQITLSIFLSLLIINMLIGSLFFLPHTFSMPVILNTLGLCISITFLSTVAIMFILNRKIVIPLIKTKINLIAAKNDPIHPEKYIILSTRIDELGQLWGITNSMLKKIGDNIKYIKAHETVLALNFEERVQEISQLANYDTITGLPNQQLFNQKANELISTLNQGQKQTGILVIELNNYKDIVHALGYENGNIFITTIAKSIENSLPPNSILARIAPDQFGIAREITNSAQFGELTAWILYRLTTPLIINNHSIVPSLNAGVSVAPIDGNSSEILLRNAQHALNFAKLNIRNTHQFYESGMSEQAEYQSTLLLELQQALEKKQLLVYYQPKINLLTNKISGMEALIRWNHPTKGILSPMDYLALAEHSGLIIPIGEWVLKTACEQTRLWNAMGQNLIVAVNLSTVQFQQKHLIETIHHTLMETQLSPESLELEITESGIMNNIQESIGIMKALRGLGISLSIDDFGTGNASLSYLKKFPIQKLKIDQSFIKDLENNQDDRDIAELIITLGHTLKLQIIAEGVETENHLAFLKSKGCDYGQGYYWSKPIDAEAFFKLVSEQSS